MSFILRSPALVPATVRTIARVVNIVRDLVPEGRPLPPDIWERRHTIIVRIVWLHALVLLTASTLLQPSIEGIGGSLVVAVLGIASHRLRASQRVRSCLAAAALLMTSSIMVHLSGGLIEMHFHFFVALSIIAFYQERVAFLVAILFVLIEHGVVGVVWPSAIYNHHAARTSPIIWAAIHAAFVSAASAASLLGWRVNEQQALHDPLTRLPNRALFRDRADHALARGRRRQQHVAVMFVDLDRFKPINDTWGHHVGDRVLIDLADRLRGTVRLGDTVARLGGDEFALLVEDLDDSLEAGHVSRRVLDALREPFLVQGRQIPLRASIGIAVSAERGADVDDLLRDADVAMYVAKQRGGARALTYDPSMRAGVAERLDLEMELRRAISAHDLQVHYQPTVDLSTGAIVGAEALLRWPHATRGNIPPDMFIPLAEETGLIVPLGLWTLQRACEQTQTWHTDFPNRTPLFISVNVSPVQLAQDGFVAEVRRIFNETGIDPTRVTLEITESALLDDSANGTLVLEQLKSLGVRLAIDDFGTGYSSLNYLQRLPIDVLKIDRSFIHRIHAGDDDLAFARAIVDLARTLSLRTVAEGIESESQADRLIELGCEQGQGFLFARPVAAEQITELLARPDPAMTAPQTPPTEEAA